MDDVHTPSNGGDGPDDAHPTMWDRARARRRRFVDRYETRREQRQRGEVHRFARPIRVTAGVVLILAGVAIGWLPGPGFVILAFPGALLIASEWRRAALLMDRVENETIPRLRRMRARLRGGPMPHWVAEDPVLWADWCERKGIPIRDGGERRGWGAKDSGERRRLSEQLDARPHEDDDARLA